MHIKKPDLRKYFALPNYGLRAYMNKTDVGSTVDYRTPFGGKAPREEILSKWDTIFDQWYKSADPSIFQSLNDFEKEMRSKVGPMSIQAPLKERLEGIQDYGTLSQFDFDLPSKEIAQVLKEYQAASGLRLRQATLVAKNMILSTNSGSPFFTRRRLVVDKSLSLYPDNKDLVAILGGRGQEGGPAPEDVKQRAVFMMPLSVNIQEGRVYQPLIEAIQRHKLIPAYISSEEVEIKMTKLFDTKDPNDLVIVTDFKKMDQHYNIGMQKVSAAVIAGLLTKDNDSNDGVKSIFPIKYNIPLLCNSNILISGHHGMGSGSTGTNLDESIGHRCLQYKAANDAHAVLNPNSQYLGDDGVISFPGITIDKIVKSYTTWGHTMNPEKQYAAKDNAVFLRKGYHIKFRSTDNVMKGVYSTYRALGRLMGQERYYDPKVGGAKMVTLRAGSILENCANHPLFEELVQFVIKGDIYRLGLDIPGFIENIDSEYESAKAQVTNGESYSRSLDKTGIKRGRIYNYLSSLK